MKEKRNFEQNILDAVDYKSFKLCVTTTFKRFMRVFDFVNTTEQALFTVYRLPLYSQSETLRQLILGLLRKRFSLLKYRRCRLFF